MGSDILPWAGARPGWPVADSRSAVIHAAVGMLRQSPLEHQYEAAFAEWDADADGIPDAPKRSERKDKADGGANGTRYLNTTNGPVVYDRDGHQVDAGAWTPPINLDTVGKAARKAEYLLPESAL